MITLGGIRLKCDFFYEKYAENVIFLLKFATENVIIEL